MVGIRPFGFEEEVIKRSHLTDAGFCPRCWEYHTDCVCEAFWVRKYIEALNECKRLQDMLNNKQKNNEEVK